MRIGGFFKKTLGWLDRLVAPPLCPRCQERLAPRGALCETCTEAVARLPEGEAACCRACGGPLHAVASGVCRRCAENPPPWFRGVSALDYHGEAGDLVRAYKYGRQTALADYFATEMARAWRLHGAPARPQVLVPVPLHPLRQMTRGFNQAALLCRLLSGRLGLPVVEALRRKRATGHQARLDAAARRRNMRRAFSVTRADRLRGKSVLLVDDVMTTGATLAACAEALAAAGAAEVSVLTVARA